MTSFFFQRYEVVSRHFSRLQSCVPLSLQREHNRALRLGELIFDGAGKQLFARPPRDAGVEYNKGETMQLQRNPCSYLHSTGVNINVLDRVVCEVLEFSQGCCGLPNFA